MPADRTLLEDFQFDNPIYAQAQVTAYGVDASGNKDTSVIVTLYADELTSSTLANPQSLTSRGKWKQPVYIDTPCILSITGPHTASHDTGIIRPRLQDSDLEAAELNAARAAGFAALADKKARDAADSAAEAAASAASFDPLQVVPFI